MMRVPSRILATAVLCGTLLLLTAASSQSGLSLAEQQLASQTGFEADVLLLIREEAKAQLHRLSGYDAEEYQIIANGIVVSVPWSRSDQVLWSLRKMLRPRNYMAFRVEINTTLKLDRIAIIKGADQYDILRIMHTNGDDDDVSHEDVLAKLKQWEKRIRFEVVGAENDWVEIEFRTMPQDLSEFVNDVYEFSPDTVDEGTGSLDDLMKDISATKRLVLWWNE